MFRTREEILSPAFPNPQETDKQTLEVLLDIRELLMKANETEKTRQIKMIIEPSHPTCGHHEKPSGKACGCVV